MFMLISRPMINMHWKVSKYLHTMKDFRETKLSDFVIQKFS